MNGIIPISTGFDRKRPRGSFVIDDSTGTLWVEFNEGQEPTTDEFLGAFPFGIVVMDCIERDGQALLKRARIVEAEIGGEVIKLSRMRRGGLLVWSTLSPNMLQMIADGREDVALVLARSLITTAKRKMANPEGLPLAPRFLDPDADDDSNG